MKLHFLGTRGGIQVRSSLHFMHSSLLVTYEHTSIIIDWGTDWLNHELPYHLTPSGIQAILITHGHDDHVGGLARGFPLRVYATLEIYKTIKHYPLDINLIEQRKPFTIGSLHIEAFPVYHSLRAPAVGYRITAGAKAIFYVSDLISIIDEKDALENIDCYIGDGAIISRTLLVRKKDSIPVGHSAIKEQVRWCQRYTVPQAIFTHCGTEITAGDQRAIKKKIQKFEEEMGVKITIATDNMSFHL